MHTQSKFATKPDETQRPLKHSESSKGAVTKSGKPKICAHRTYKLTCAEFDELEMRSKGRCEICGTGDRRLVIDHDHARGIDAVRGLLCDPCNQHLRRVDIGKTEIDETTSRYLAHRFREGGGEYVRWETNAQPSTVRFNGATWDAACEVAARKGDDLISEMKKFLAVYAMQNSSRHARK